MPRDNFLPLIPAGTTLTAATNGASVDLMKGTNVQKDGTLGVDLLGNAGLVSLLVAVAVVSNFGGTGGPAAALQLSQSDDNAVWTALGAATATGNGDVQIPFSPTKRFVRLDLIAFTGTAPTATFDAYVGVREF